MLRTVFFLLFLWFSLVCSAQISWKNVDSLYQPLPPSVHVYFYDASTDTGKFRAFYVIADLKSKKLDFTTDTSYKRRLTPSQFYQKNNQPLVVVNGTFFSFETNQNLNLVIKNNRLLTLNKQTIAGRGKDTLTYRHVFASAIGITKKRKADVAWLYTDSVNNFAYAVQAPTEPIHDSILHPGMEYVNQKTAFSINPPNRKKASVLKKWEMETAIGGGPVVLQNGEIKITNNEELKFSGKAIHDNHPRTAMGYTKDGRLIILVIEGRNPNAQGATLVQEAQILKNLGCQEALNLDGGGSSCLLINGKETIKPSDKEGQRAVPAVFIIQMK